MTETIIPVYCRYICIYIVVVNTIANVRLKQKITHRQLLIGFNCFHLFRDIRNVCEQYIKRRRQQWQERVYAAVRLVFIQLHTKPNANGTQETSATTKTIPTTSSCSSCTQMPYILLCMEKEIEELFNIFHSTPYSLYDFFSFHFLLLSFSILVPFRTGTLASWYSCGWCLL